MSIGTSSSICLGDVALGIGGVHVLRTVFLLPVSQFWSMETLLFFSQFAWFEIGRSFISLPLFHFHGGVGTDGEDRCWRGFSFCLLGW